MADQKISAMTDGSPAVSTDVLPIERGAAANFRLTLANILTLFSSSLVLQSSSWFTFVGGGTTATANGTALVAAYAAAILKTPGGNALSASNRHTIVLLPGVYSVSDGALVMNTQFVDIIGLSVNSGAVVYSAGFSDNGDTIITSVGHTLEQSVNDVTIANVCLRTSSATKFAYNLTTTATTFTKLINVLLLNTDAVSTASMPPAVTMAGYYQDVRAWNSASFGRSNTAVCSGVFIRVKCGGLSFACALSSGSVASGTFTDCEGDGGAFGTNGTASGIFDRCKFVAIDSTSSPMFGGSATASGRFTNCVGNGITGCFGTTSTGIFKVCYSDPTGAVGSAFGGGGGTASGSYQQCASGNGSFGGNNGGAGGTFNGFAEGCVALRNCFGGGSTTAGSMAGQILACKMRGRLNATVSSRIAATDIIADGTNEDAVLVNSSAIITRCTLVGTGSGFSVNAASPVTPAIYLCAMNLGFGANVTNLITTPYNVNQTAIA